MKYGTPPGLVTAHWQNTKLGPVGRTRWPLWPVRSCSKMRQSCPPPTSLDALWAAGIWGLVLLVHFGISKSTWSAFFNTPLCGHTSSLLSTLFPNPTGYFALLVISAITICLHALAISSWHFSLISCSIMEDKPWRLRAAKEKRER